MRLSRPPQPKPTESELAILDVLWDRGEATVRDVYEALYQQDGGGYTTALKLLQVMHGKGLVERDDSQRAHVFRAVPSRESTRNRMLGTMIEQMFGGRPMDLVLSLLGTEQAPKSEEIAQVRALLDRLERGQGRHD